MSTLTRSTGCAQLIPISKIRAGIELDNDPVHSASGRAWVEKNWDQLDFVLGSVHFLRGDWAFDHAGEEAEFRRRDIDEVYADYYARIREMAASGLVDCMAHLDLVKIFGLRPTTDLGDLLEAVLSEIRGANLAMELLDRRLAQTGGRALSERRNHPSGHDEGNPIHDRVRWTFACAAGGKLRPVGAKNDRSWGIREVSILERHRRAAVLL